MHRLALLRLMWCLLHSLALLFAILSILLFLDVDLFYFPCSFVVGCRGSSSGLPKCWQRKVGMVALGSVSSLW